MEILITLLVVILIAIQIAAIALGGFLAWVASGEADVNGDPERDAGASCPPPIRRPRRISEAAIGRLTPIKNPHTQIHDRK